MGKTTNLNWWSPDFSHQQYVFPSPCYKTKRRPALSFWHAEELPPDSGPTRWVHHWISKADNLMVRNRKLQVDGKFLWVIRNGYESDFCIMGVEFFAKGKYFFFELWWFISIVIWVLSTYPYVQRYPRGYWKVSIITDREWSKSHLVC